MLLLAHEIVVAVLVQRGVAWLVGILHVLGHHVLGFDIIPVGFDFDCTPVGRVVGTLVVVG